MADNDITPGEMRAFKTYMELETHLLAAKALNISTQTLKNHLGSVYRKVGKRKAHSVLYKMCLDQGMDPLAGPVIGDVSTNQTAPLTDSEFIAHNDTDETAS